MIDLQYHSIKVQIDLPNGVYVFPRSSADGKTYLSSILRALGPDDGVNSYTLDDKDFFDVSVALNSEKYKLVLLDRYDMYFGDGIEEIQEFGKAGVVLIDCKSHDFPFEVKYCFLHMEIDKIMVFE